MTEWCVHGNCHAAPVLWSHFCFEHDPYSDPNAGAEPPDPRYAESPVYNWDIVCLMCGERRSARGTDQDAQITKSRLGACRCGGLISIERADLGAISSAQAVHIANYRSMVKAAGEVRRGIS